MMELERTGFKVTDLISILCKGQRRSYELRGLGFILDSVESPPKLLEQAKL